MTRIAGARSTASRLSLPDWDRNPRQEAEAIVVEQRPIVGNEFEIVFHAPAIAETARPGQFVEILFGENYAPLVRRPFSIYRVDREAGTCSVLYVARGAFTSELARKRPGDRASLLGPLGRPFHCSSDPGVQHILVAGGLGAPPLYFLACELTGSLSREARGVRTECDAVRSGRNMLPGSLSGDTGARRTSAAADPGPGERASRAASGRASGRSAERASPGAGEPIAARVAGRVSPRGRARAGVRESGAATGEGEVARSRLVVINAARTESLLVGVTEFGDLNIALHVMTDDGSRGTRGMATDLLVRLLDAEISAGIPKAIYACGPMPMLRSVGEIAIRLGLPCQLSIETSMPCGIGLCQGCATPVRDPESLGGFSYALACVDGPVFEARDLVWP
jgi:NAD(P)H-flavin reductase